MYLRPAGWRAQFRTAGLQNRASQTLTTGLAMLPGSNRSGRAQAGPAVECYTSLAKQRSYAAHSALL